MLSRTAISIEWIGYSMAVKHRWRLEQLVSGVGVAGDNAQDWALVRDIWLKRTHISARDVVLGGGSVDEYKNIFTAHFCDDLKNGMRLVRGDSVLKIDSFYDTYDDRKQLTVLCTEVK